jgi:methyl-accepting chemotaxis protein
VKKFKLQVLAALGAIIAIIIILIALLDYLAFRSESLELNEQILREKNTALAAEITEKFVNYQVILSSLEIKNYEFGKKILSEENTTSLFALYGVLKNRINGVYLFDKTGAVFKRTGKKSNSNYKNRSYYKALFEEGKNFYVSSPYVNKTNGKYSIAIAYKINQDIALSITVHLNTFLDSFANRTDLFVYTENGTIIAAPNKALFGKKIKDEHPEFQNFSALTPELQFIQETDRKNVNYTAFWGEVSINGWHYVSLVKESDINKSANTQLLYTLLIGLVCFLLACGILLTVIQRLVLTPVGGAPEGIAQLMEKMAAGQLSLNLVANESDTGIYRSLVSLSFKLNTLVSNSVNISQNVSSAAQQLTTVMSETLSNIEQEKQQVEQISTATYELSQTSIQVSEKAKGAEKETEQSLSVLNDGKKTLEKNIALASDINHSVTETATIVDELRKFSIEIGTVTDVINGISEQTNLLALNAAIEAARAGEAGRGFSVVADEVRALASKTQESTVNIQEIIKKLQEKSELANSNMLENVTLIEGSVELADQVKGSFEKISNAIDALAKINTMVASASVEQTGVTEELSQNTSVASNLVQQNVTAINQTLQASNELAQLAQTQKDELSYFKV